MPLPQAEPVETELGEPETAYDSYGDLRLGGVTVGEYDTQNDAGLATYVLDLEDIRSVAGDGSGRFDLRLPFVRVAPEDVEKATVILARPVSAQTKADYQELRTLPDFEVPGCPHCSCAEVLLEEVEPTNRMALRGVWSSLAGCGSGRDRGRGEMRGQHAHPLLSGYLFQGIIDACLPSGPRSLEVFND